MTFRRFVTKITRRVPHVEQDLPTLPEQHEFPTYFHRVFFSLWEEKFEDTKGVTRSRKSKKNRQCNGRNTKEHNVKKGIRTMLVNATFNDQRPGTRH
jgi:hypothetical protein